MRILGLDILTKQSRAGLSSRAGALVMYHYRMEQTSVRRVRLATVEDLPSGAQTLRAAAIEAGFEVMATKVVETSLVVVHGLHPERGRFECAWVNGLSTSGFFAPPRPEWRMVPDLRSGDSILRNEEGDPIMGANRKPKPNTKRKPKGIGLERPEMIGGFVGVTAVKAWIVG